MSKVYTVQISIDERNRRYNHIIIGNSNNLIIDQINFDCSEFERVYGQGTAQIYYMNDKTEYGIPLQSILDGIIAKLEVPEEVTSVSGIGCFIVVWNLTGHGRKTSGKIPYVITEH